MNEEKIRSICRALTAHIEEKNVCVFRGRQKPLFLISENYHGVWLEHLFDAIIYAEMYPEKGKEIAENTIELFLSNQKENGQYPCYVWDGNRSKLPDKYNLGWAQVQECVSFGQLFLRFLNFSDGKDMALRGYRSLKKWVQWLSKYRMTTKRGLIEAFVGYDTGHDNSGRLKGMRFPNNYILFGREQNAAKRHFFDPVAPLLATDMNAVFYGNLRALEKLAKKLGFGEEERKWKERAEEIKRQLFLRCYDKNDDFFYDVDKNDKKRKYLSCAILHFFQEGVLDREEDEKVINNILKKHVLNEEEFWTPYPFPSMAKNDPSTKKHKKRNDWGYFTQGNTVLRTVLWMDKYGLRGEQDRVCKAWLEGWTACFERMPVGQELDPITGEPSPSAPWYSSGMLFYLWSAKRLGIID